MQMAEGLQRHTPDCALRHLGEDGVAQFGEELRQQAFFSAFLKEERCRQLRATLTEFGAAILSEARRHGPIDAVASANMDYWQDETMKLGCTALGIPFLVLCRENHTIPWTSPWKHEHIAKAKFRFNTSN